MRDLSEIERGAQEATKGPWMQTELECNTYTDVMAPHHQIDGPGVDEDTGIGIVWCDGLGGCQEDAEFIAHARTDVPDMAAQIRADDALLLACEWAAEDECGVNKYGEVSFIPVCPVCGQSCKRGHRDGCDLGRRCDEARARQVQ